MDQHPADQGPMDQGPMDQAAADSIIREVIRLAQEHYVFPDVGARIGKLLTERAAAGGYAGAAGQAALAELVTRDLQSVNGDKHLRLQHSDTEVAQDDDDAQLAALAGLADLTCDGIARAERLDGNVGYLDLRPILFPPSISGDAAAAAMSLIARTDALIIDLRQCLGGDPEMVTLMCSYLFGREPVHLNDLYERESESVRQYWTMPYTPGRRLRPDVPVDLLTSGVTFSGGEELCYDLQQLGRGTVIGEPTGGGAHPQRSFRVRPHLRATIPVARAISPVSGTNWEGTGVIPDIEVPAGEAFPVAYRRALNHVLSLGTGSGRAQCAAEAQAALASLP
jgi:C-terminal processing protease CtpA/Prc